MVLKNEQYNLEQLLGSKVSIALLRYLCANPYLSFGLTQLSIELEISKSNLLRVLGILVQNNIIIALEKGKKKAYRLNSGVKITNLLWQLFMEEKIRKLDYRFKNTVELFFNNIDKDIGAFILFGSVAQGLATDKSDIDILVVGDKKLKGVILDYLPARIEVHNYTWQELKHLKDFVVLEAIMNGIVYKGNIFEILAELRYFPKSYLLYRLQKCKGYMDKLDKLKGESKRYYLDLIRTTLGEIDAILHKKRTIPKREIEINISAIRELEKEISLQGEKIWLI